MSEPTLSRTEAIILNLLISSRKELYGLELVASSQGKLKRGTVYVTLGRMEEKGFVKSYRESTDDAPHAIPRRLYKPTGEGELALRNFFDIGAAALSHAAPA